MKKLKLLMVAFMAMLGLGANAQSWTAPQSETPVDGGSYKVVNVGSAMYLAMGKAWFSWSTTAILASDGIDFTLTKDGNNWKFIRTGTQGVFTSGNGINGDAMHVDNTAHSYGITKLPNGNYHIHDANGNAESPCWGYNSSFHATGVVAHADATAEGWMCEWLFINPSAATPLYVAKLKLYSLLNKAYNDGADTDAAAAVYNNSEATIDEINAAYDKLNLVVSLIDVTKQAKAIDQTVKMSSAALSGLQKAIASYGEGVDLSDEAAVKVATDALNAAVAFANISINSYKLVASGVIPDNSLDGWTCTNTNTFHINTWSVEGNSDGSNMKTPFIENWVGKGNYLGAGVVSYTLEGLEPGDVYYAQALVRSYNEANSDAPNGPNFFINDVEVSLPEAGTTFTYNGMSGIYATLGDVATVGEDGKLTLGVKIAEDRNYNWVAFKNVSIQSMSDAIAKAKANAAALEGKIPTGAYTALNNFVAEHSAATVANISAINAKVEEYNAFVAPFAAFNTMEEIADELAAAGTDNPTGQASLLNEITAQADAVDKAEDVDGINQATEALKAAMTTYAYSSNPVGEGAQFNMTFVLVNPNLEGLPTWQKASGWYTDQTEGNSQVMTNGNATSADGTKTAFFEYYNNPAKANNEFALYQKQTLPAGTYKMTCYAFAQDDANHVNYENGVYFYANETPGSAVNNSRLSEAQIDFVNDKEQEVKIGLKTVTGNKNKWMGIGYVQLYRVPAVTVEISEAVDYTPESGAAKVTLKRTLTADKWNTFVVPFQINNEELKAAFGEDVAVAEYSEVAEGINSTVSFNKMETPAVAPNKPVLLKPVTVAANNEYVFEGRTIAAGEAKVAGTNFDFVGTYAASTTVAEGDYFIGENKLWRSTGATTIKGTRAYIKTKTAGATARLVIDGEETTGIETVAAKKQTSEKIYNLNGQVVNRAQKGIFIMNGKKVVK